MFLLGTMIAAAVLFGALSEFSPLLIREKCKYGAKMTVPLLAVLAVLVAFLSPVFGQDSIIVKDSTTSQDSIVAKTISHTFTKHLGPLGNMTISVDTLTGQKLSIAVMGKTVSVDIDSSEMPLDTVMALIDSLGKGAGMVKKIAITQRLNASENEEEEKSEDKVSGLINSFLHPVSTIFIVMFSLLAAIILILGIPFLLFIILYRRWKWVHEERMKAIEQGIVLPTQDAKSTIDKPTAISLRKGVILAFVGAGFIIAGFWNVLGVILLMWGLGYIVWYLIFGHRSKNLIDEQSDKQN